MSVNHFGILEDAPKESTATCCFGLFNKSQLKYFALLWLGGLIVIAAIIVIPFLSYKLLPTPLTSSKAGLLQFSEERYVVKTKNCLTFNLFTSNERYFVDFLYRSNQHIHFFFQTF
jgi:hypothetical protein